MATFIQFLSNVTTIVNLNLIFFIKYLH